MIVLTSFFWGIFVFGEHVKSKFGACCACGTLVLGLIGMSVFSRPQSTKEDIEEGMMDKKGIKLKKKLKKEPEIVGEPDLSGEDEEDNEGGVRKRIDKRIHSSQDLKAAISKKGPSNELKASISKRGGSKKSILSPKKSKIEKVQEMPNATGSAPSSLPITALEMESLLIDKDKIKAPQAPDDRNKTISLFEGQIILTKRQAGLIASLFNGLWGGTNMIPLHFAAHSGYGGPSYVVSFACGSMLVTIWLWVLRYLYEVHRHDGAFGKAYHALPSFHIRQIWLQVTISDIIE